MRLRPGTLTIRELEVGGRVLVTTLTFPNTIPKDALKDLYKRRWQVELDIRNIKTTLGMETLSCKTPQMGEKEMWVYLLAYNLIRLIMAQSALMADVLPRTGAIKSDALAFSHQAPFFVNGLPIILPLLVDSAQTQCQHIINIIGCPPGTRTLKSSLYNVAMSTFNFS